MGKEMILIAHRGNTDGPNPKKENKPSYLHKALNEGYQIEIDVWYEGRQWWLGHDKPQWKTGLNLLRVAWCHLKNSEALEKIAELSPMVNYFWHESDDYTITSKGYIWCHVDAIPVSNCIRVLPEKSDIEFDFLNPCLGVCSDYVANPKVWMD